jgi:uncharacterized protein (TIGR03437 family)
VITAPTVFGAPITIFAHPCLPLVIGDQNALALHMTNSLGNRSLLERVAQCRQELARGSILFLSAVGLLAQSPVILGTPDPTVVVALGQVTTLTFVGAPAKLPIGNGPAVQQASEIPLPTTLAGFSAIISQQPNQTSEPLPIFRVKQEDICLDQQQTPACVLTLLTVQIPADLELSNYEVGPQTATSIQVFADGINITYYVALDPVKVHILTACDTVGGSRPTELSACNPLITHADGTLVGPFSGPNFVLAKPGETLILYAWGLGITQPSVPPGTVSPTTPAFAVHRFTIILDYDCGVIQAVTPDFVGLTPGQVGLYQVNFKVPQPVACTMFPNTPDRVGSGGNLTLLSDDWVSSDTALLYLGADSPTTGSVLPKAARKSSPIE